MKQEFWDEISEKINIYSSLHNSVVTSPRYLKAASMFYKLSSVQFNVLVLCYNMGALSISDITKKLNIHHSSASRLVSSLVRQNHLRRFKTPENKAKVFVELTGPTREILDERLVALRQNLESNLRGILDDEGLEKFSKCYDFLISVYEQFKKTENGGAILHSIEDKASSAE